MLRQNSSTVIGDFMSTEQEIEEKFKAGFELIKMLEALSQERKDEFQVHVERIQGLQFLVGRLQELRTHELSELAKAAPAETEILDAEVLSVD
jgi:response regulator RpfG family c-di-GMP phosphodiesterase